MKTTLNGCTSAPTCKSRWNKVQERTVSFTRRLANWNDQKEKGVLKRWQLQRCLNAWGAEHSAHTVLLSAVCCNAAFDGDKA